MAVSVAKQIESVKKSVEKMDRRETAIIGAPSAGDVVRQGDLYLICLDASPKGKKLATRQLAPGTSQGSRHIMDGDCELLEVDSSEMAATVNRLVRGANVPAELIGPAVRCFGDSTATHPEHGWRILPRDTAWAVVFQRDHAEEIRRVQD